MKNKANAKNKKLDLQKYFFTTNYRITQPMEGKYEFPHLTEIYGDLIAEDLENSNSSLNLGTVSVAIFHIDRIHKGRESLYEYFDSDGNKIDFYSALFDLDTDCYHDYLLTDEFTSNVNLFIIERVEIDEKYRGYDLGLKAVKEAIKVFAGGCAVVGIKPMPLQWAGKAGNLRGKKKLQFKRELKKLKNHWAKLGFVPTLHDEDIFYMSLD